MNMRDPRLGFVLLALGALLLLSNLNGADSGWMWVAAPGALFLYGWRQQRQPGFAVPGGILVGIAAGILLEEVLGLNDFFLFGLAGGFYLVNVLEPRVHRWALWPASIIGVIAALVIASTHAWLTALVLVLAGLYLLGGGSTRRAPALPAAPADAERDRANRLAAWRAGRAASDGLTPTDVLRNDQLERIAREAPRSPEALKGVLEPLQHERYAQEIVTALYA
ncbi:MAG TPA: HRDC domain-containing protein [Deinococcales bacterium]|nr:HRDC domain-containing protein [Deinococcales bacterium]